VIIYPAIDLKDGQVVRLLQGKMEQATVYADDPVRVAADFLAQGSDYLHVVDLNGAFQGKPGERPGDKKHCGGCTSQDQVGGGIRTLERIEELLSLGVSRVILGTVCRA
jgi:phosphoribosylformimino-5-aminoimidazole carboxamide ribotide isomerase